MADSQLKYNNQHLVPDKQKLAEEAKEVRHQQWAIVPNQAVKNALRTETLG